MDIQNEDELDYLSNKKKYKKYKKKYIKLIQNIELNK
jgi:hypothetical protein